MAEDFYTPMIERLIKERDGWEAACRTTEEDIRTVARIIDFYTAKPLD
jgi:hypothetical protein